MLCKFWIPRNKCKPPPGYRWLFGFRSLKKLKNCLQEFCFPLPLQMRAFLYPHLPPHKHQLQPLNASAATTPHQDHPVLPRANLQSSPHGDCTPPPLILQGLQQPGTAAGLGQCMLDYRKTHKDTSDKGEMLHPCQSTVVGCMYFGSCLLAGKMQSEGYLFKPHRRTLGFY